MQVALDAHRLGGHRAEQRGAVRDRLVGRRAQLAGEPARGLEAHVHRLALTLAPPGSRGRRSAPARARRARSPAIHSATTPWRLSCGGRQRHVGDVDARAAERERDLGDHARAVGHRRAQLVHRAARRGRRRAAPRARRARARSRPSTRRARRRPRAPRAPRRSRAIELVDARRSARRGWTGRCRSRSRCWRRRRGWRRGSSARPRAAAAVPSAPSSAGGLRDEQVGEHVRQVRDARHQAVVGVGVDRRRPRAEAARAAGAGARTARPAVLPRRASGTRWRRRTGPRARARTPAVSAPASGCPPTKRSSRARPRRARLVEPTSLTTQSRRRAAERERARSRASAPTGAATNTTSAPATAPATSAACASIAPSASAAGAHALVGVIAAHLGVRARARGQADRAADQPDAEDGDLQGACLAARPIRRR